MSILEANVKTRVAMFVHQIVVCFELKQQLQSLFEPIAASIVKRSLKIGPPAVIEPTLSGEFLQEIVKRLQLMSHAREV